ncbi:MAG TPA: DUF364 domain-containing protein [Anaerolineaceae bacterium]|nr:DUF364 domain-containing protein [Anaerolineaceae bacterium]
MLIEKVFQAAEPLLRDRVLTDAVLGLSLTAIELDNRDIGLSYILRDRLPAGCSAFGFAQHIIGQSALEVARLVLEGRDDAQRGVGMAVITAATRAMDLPNEPTTPTPFGLQVRPADKVGMIGYIPPVVDQLIKLGANVTIFDKGLTVSGGDGSKQVMDMSRQSEILPMCDLMIISGSTLINSTIDHLLELCQNAREIVLVGASTPMFSEVFKGTGVTALAGSWWDAAQKVELFKILSLSGGISHVKKMMIKKLVPVER